MKRAITLLKRPQLKNPVFVAAWPGMGNVALKAALFLREKLKAEEFAVFHPDSFFQPSGIDIDNQIITTTKLPEGRFYFYKNALRKHDVVIFISEAQPLFEKSYEYAKQIVDFIKELQVKMAFTFAALPSPIEHTKTPLVWASATHKSLLEQLNKIPIKIMSNGQISGLNGLLLGVAKEAGIPGVCLLGEIPLYTIQIENPLASLAVLDALSKFISIRIDYSELEGHARVIRDEIEKLIDFLKDPESHHSPIGLEEIEKIKDALSAYTKTPESVRKKVEQLFGDAEQDITKASALKNELDHWGIYKEYEDRFLDLFKKLPPKDN